MRKINVGFLGCGNIGGGVWSLLEDMRADIARCFQVSFEVKRMLVRALDEPRAVPVPETLLTTDPEDILSDPQIDLVCEFMGGEQPAANYMLRALKNGKHVVTANKMALSLHWTQLHEAAYAAGVQLFYEASVCGAIPVIRTVSDAITASRIDRIYGIVNGTTNYILTQMQEQGLPYETALKEAQRLGLAEPDPTSDVEGYDAAYKLSILSALCFGVYATPADIPCTGISSVDIRDIRLGRKLGLCLKLLAQAEKGDKGISACVSPTFVAKESQLANVNGAFNGVLLHGHACDDIFLYGRGAGSLPTASAIVADMIQVGRNKALSQGHDWTSVVIAATTSCRYYIRLDAQEAFLADACMQEAFLCGTQKHILDDENSQYAVYLSTSLSAAELHSLKNKLSDVLQGECVIWPVKGDA